MTGATTARIYTLSDPRTGEVRYVGWTSRRPAARLSQHLCDARMKPGGNHRLSWLRSLLAYNLLPIMKIVALVEVSEAPETEIRLIAMLRARGGRLVNSTDGGEGAVGYSPNAETRVRLSEISRARWSDPEYRGRMSLVHKGKKLSPFTSEHKRRISISKLGKKRGPHSPETKAKISVGNLGKKRSQEACARNSAAHMDKKLGPMSLDHRSKLSAALRGRTFSPETRARMSAAARARRKAVSIAAVLLCALLLTGCATSKGARRVTIALSLADIATTQYAIGNGFDEANPIYRRNPVERALVVNFAYIFAMDRATDRMEEEQRKYTWEWLAAVRALPVLWNAWTLAHGHASTACPARALVKEDW